MKRGGPLRRTKPLQTDPVKQQAWQQRSTPLARSRLKSEGSPMRRTPLKAVSTTRSARGKAEHAPIPAAVRQVVLQRCRGLCEACSEPLSRGGQATHYHHRLRRSRGGTNDVANIVALHALCHVLGDHAVHEIGAEAYRRGLMIRGHQDPARVPLMLADGSQVFLGPVYLAA